MTNRSPVSVVVPAHNAAETIGDQLEALARQVDAPPFEVFVVLNRCTDATGEVVRRHKRNMPTTAVTADAKPSAAYARNFGAAHSNSDILLFCDADDRADSGWVSAMHRALTSGDADFVGGAITVDRDGLRPWAYESFYKWSDEPALHTMGGLRYPISASLGIQRKAFESVGGFDEDFAGAGWEEIDLATRLLRSGFRVGLAADAKMLYRPRTRPREIVRQQRSYAGGMATFYAKEGREVAVPGLATQAKRLARGAARRIVRDHQFNPIAHATLALTDLAKVRAGEVVRPSASLDPSSVEGLDDFVVPLETPRIGGLAFQADRAVGSWYSTTGTEVTSLRVVDALLPRGGTFVDCGANVGVFSVCAALVVGPTGRVVSFEPDERTRRSLNLNLRRHAVAAQVTVCPSAVGASRGQLPLRRYSNDVVSGFFEAPPEHAPGRLISEDIVDVVALDDLDLDQPDMMKIDVEGAEPDVLAGARGLLDTTQDMLVMVELNAKALAAGHRSVNDLVAHLPASRWSVWTIRDRPEVGQPKIAQFSKDDPSLAVGYCNLLAVPNSRASDVEATLRSI